MAKGFSNILGLFTRRSLQINHSQKPIRPLLISRKMASLDQTDSLDTAQEMDIGAHGGDRGAGRGGRGGRGGRRGGGGGAGRGASENREVLISKALSKLLRHAADEAGLKLDAEGFAPLDEVVSQNRPSRSSRIQSRNSS